MNGKDTLLAIRYAIHSLNIYGVKRSASEKKREENQFGQACLLTEGRQRKYV
jgi:hypothetical protein